MENPLPGWRNSRGFLLQREVGGGTRFWEVVTDTTNKDREYIRGARSMWVEVKSY